MPTSDRRSRRAAATAIAFAAVLVVTACSSSKKTAASPTPHAVGTSATTTPPTAPTTPAPPPVAPLTGLPQPDSAKRNRVALVVKIDNVDPARPQAGLGAADVVYEEMVEGRVTRLIAVFQSTDAARLGPVRSTRTTDLAVVSSLNHPLYAYSGGNPGYVAQLRASPVTDVGADAYGGAYYRSGSNAPHNLYTSTTALFGAASGPPHPPSPLFTYRAAGQPAGNGAGPATHLDLNFGFSAASWDWDPASQTWKRGQNGVADVEQSGQQLAAANVIVQIIPYTVDGYAVGEGLNPPPAIPKGQTVGSGTAVVLTGAGVINSAHWTKASPTSVTQFTDASGQPIQLTPGRTWIELAPTGTASNIH